MKAATVIGEGGDYRQRNKDKNYTNNLARNCATRKTMDDIFKALKKKKNNCQATILYPLKTSFKGRRYFNFLKEEKLRESVSVHQNVQKIHAQSCTNFFREKNVMLGGNLNLQKEMKDTRNEINKTKCEVL